MPTDPTLAIQTQALSKHYGRNGEIKALQARVLARRKSGRSAGSTAAAGELSDGDESVDPGSTLPTTRVATGPRQQPRRKPRSRR